MIKTQVGASGSRRPRKSLGQHFLTDTRIAARIVAAAALDADDTVVEVGPGRGVLTRRLVEAAGRVIAVELDPSLAAELPGRLGEPHNLTVVHGDARAIDLSGFTAPDSLRDGSWKVVANLPYYAASPIVRRFLESDPHPALMVVMVQREVAEAMCASPGSMSLLSVATQFYAVATVVTQVPARAFRPAPKVASTVVKLTLRDVPPAVVDDTAAFFALVRSGFAAPRKTLRNSVTQGSGCPADVVSAALEAAGIDGQRRPATLTIPEWAGLDASWPAHLPRERDRSAAGRRSRQ
jgi:16S rRNA (adenine1518-N6/adenine1519-N6)-dimethyltransferase